jgi:hypothetical protein
MAGSISDKGISDHHFDTTERADAKSPADTHIGSFRRARPTATENQQGNRHREGQVRLTTAVVLLVIAGAADAQENPLAKIGLVGHRRYKL